MKLQGEKYNTHSEHKATMVNATFQTNIHAVINNN